MRSSRRSIALVPVLAGTLLLAGCPNGGSTATVTLSGDVVCTRPVSVTGTATNVNNATLNISATVTCAGTGVAGIMLDGRLPLPTGDRTHSWGPTNAAGTATTSINISSVVVGTYFHVIVKDVDGNVVQDTQVTIQ